MTAASCGGDTGLLCHKRRKTQPIFGDSRKSVQFGASRQAFACGRDGRQRAPVIGAVGTAYRDNAIHVF